MSAIAIDPLIAEAKERARRRRLYLVVVVVAAVVAGGAFFWRFTLGPESRWPLPAARGSSSLASARFPGYGLSFRYPANWKRLDCVEDGSFTSTLTYLTNAPSAACPNGDSGPPLVRRLGADGVLVDWSDSPAGYGYTASRQPDMATLRGRKATIGGLPALFPPVPASTCSWVGGGVAQVVTIQRPGVGSGDWLTVTACFRGPNVSANAAAFRQMLASVRFSGSSG